MMFLIRHVVERSWLIERINFEMYLTCCWGVKGKEQGVISGKIKDEDTETDKIYGVYSP